MATVALTVEQYEKIITTMKEGVTNAFRANPRIAAALMVEANLGIRIGDVLNLTLADIVRDGGRYRLDIVEEKTGKKRTFTVTPEMYSFLRDYADDHDIGKHDRLFPLTVRAIQKHLKAVTDLLEIESVSTHSFRKFYATQMYENNGHDVALVQKLLQHTTPATTQRYIGVSEDRVEAALKNHNFLI